MKEEKDQAVEGYRREQKEKQGVTLFWNEGNEVVKQQTTLKSTQSAQDNKAVRLRNMAAYRHCKNFYTETTPRMLSSLDWIIDKLRDFHRAH